MRVLMGLIVGVGMVWGQAGSGSPQSGHCGGTGIHTLSNHEVPIIVEDGSIRLVAYRSHFDQNLLARALDPKPATLALTKKKKTSTKEQEEPIGKWHTHDGEHLLQIAVAVPNSLAKQVTGKLFHTQLHQFTLLASDKVEVELEQDNVAADSVWFSKEVAKVLTTPCHPTPTTEAERLGWIMRGPGNIQKTGVAASNTTEYVNLEYIPGSNKQGLLKLRGVRVWSAMPQKNKRAKLKAAFDLGTGCAAIQICPNDKDGVPVCLPMEPPCTTKRYRARAGEKLEVLQK